MSLRPIKAPCGCYITAQGEEWRVVATAFTCTHKRGDLVTDAADVRVVTGRSPAALAKEIREALFGFDDGCPADDPCDNCRPFHALRELVQRLETAEAERDEARAQLREALR